MASTKHTSSSPDPFSSRGGEAAIGSFHRYPIVLCLRAIAVCLLVFSAEIAHGQSTSADSNADRSAVNWGLASLYHGEGGLRGAASCATTACHGGPRAGVASEVAPRGSEYALWLESDPHAKSWRTISSDASLRILSNLGIVRDGAIVLVDGFRNCLACHNTDRHISMGTDIRPQSSPRITEGIGCESCHGPSESWYDTHFRGQNSIEQAKKHLGLTDLKSLVHRAKMCCLCHVGSEDRDMNHDIIAAGHPALYFDMAVYHEAYPKHWRDEPSNQADFRAQLWLAGQIAMADSELELIRSRIDGSSVVSVWPELSNFQCTGCHVALDGIPRQTSSIDLERIANGRVAVRNWNLDGIASSSRALATDDSLLEMSLTKLRGLLETPNSEPALIRAQADNLRDQHYDLWQPAAVASLDQWTSAKQLKLSAGIMGQARRTANWETAARAYTAAWAVRPSLSSAKLSEAMEILRSGLLFPDNSQSPRFPRSTFSLTPPDLFQWNKALDEVTKALEQEQRP